MAEQTGVQSRESGNDHPGQGGSNKLGSKKNRKWIYIGGAGIAVLLLGHKGGQSGASGGLDPNAAAQAQSDYAAQAQTLAALNSAGALEPGGVAPTTISTLPADTPSDIAPAGDGGGGSSDASSAGASSGASDALTGADISLDGAVLDALNRAAPPPHEAPKHTKPKPTKNKGKNAGKPKPPSHGAKVQNHTGATARGRQFPGAQHVTVGAPRNVNGNVHETVTVNYGGHTERHTAVNGGSHWLDNVKGGNPPSRGPQTHHGSVAAPRSATASHTSPQPVARPAPRPAQHPAQHRPAARRR